MTNTYYDSSIKAKAGYQIQANFSSHFPSDDVTQPTEDLLRTVLAQFGEICDIVVKDYIQHKDESKQEGYALVTYVHEDSAKKAIEEGKHLELKGITVDCAPSVRNTKQSIGSATNNAQSSNKKSVTASSPIPSLSDAFSSATLGTLTDSNDSTSSVDSYAMSSQSGSDRHSPVSSPVPPVVPALSNISGYASNDVHCPFVALGNSVQNRQSCAFQYDSVQAKLGSARQQGVVQNSFLGSVNHYNQPIPRWNMVHGSHRFNNDNGQGNSPLIQNDRLKSGPEFNLQHRTIFSNNMKVRQNDQSMHNQGQVGSKFSCNQQSSHSLGTNRFHQHFLNNNDGFSQGVSCRSDMPLTYNHESDSNGDFGAFPQYSSNVTSNHNSASLTQGDISTGRGNGNSSLNIGLKSLPVGYQYSNRRHFNNPTESKMWSNRDSQRFSNSMNDSSFIRDGNKVWSSLEPNSSRDFQFNHTGAYNRNGMPISISSDDHNILAANRLSSSHDQILSRNSDWSASPTAVIGTGKFEPTVFSNIDSLVSSNSNCTLLDFNSSLNFGNPQLSSSWFADN